MQQQEHREGEAGSEERLKSVLVMLDSVTKMLAERVRTFEAGSQVRTTEAQSLTTELRKWALLAIEEQGKIERRLREQEGSGSDGSIDFTQAVAQIGSRLARLRAARGAGEFPSEPDEA